MKCSFCGHEINDRVPGIEGAVANICLRCLEVCNEEADELKIESTEKITGLLKPHEIKSEFDKYIIGQEEAKKLLAVEAYNHYKRINSKSKIDIQKTNVMLVGPSGSGKTYIVEILARILNVPFTISDATGLTEAGYVGKDVESILVSLIEKSNGDISLAERGIIYIDEIDKIVSQNPDIGKSKDVGGEGVQQSLLKMIEGSEITVEISGPLLKKRSVTINTKNILFICGGAFNGIEGIAKKRLEPNKHKSIGFNSEESTKYNNEPKYYKIEPDDMIKYGFINEFIGRVPLIATLHKLTERELVDILTKPKNSIVKQYQALLRMDNVKLKFSKDALEHIAKGALKQGVGARGLRGIIAKKMNELMYFIPMKEDIKEFTVTKEYLTKDHRA
ncbi:TPA: ATP-dependent Clp protease ATP-binding subunit ClpX [Clostridium botulinum]|nr:ATP-dependent Clp protease ATP-binding subunit ClpX [Clostridium botulinum]